MPALYNKPPLSNLCRSVRLKTSVLYFSVDPEPDSVAVTESTCTALHLTPVLLYHRGLKHTTMLMQWMVDFLSVK